MDLQRVIEFIPVLTTVLAAVFAFDIFTHYRKHPSKYLLWWTIGFVNYALATLSESINILWGWSEFNFKFWYITGALLASYTLAQGNIYQLVSNRFGNISAFICIVYVVIASFFVVSSPLEISESNTGKLTGELFAWQWVRMFSPFINTYTFLFLFGGAIYSANKFFMQFNKEAGFMGNIYISFGALLVGTGGFYSKLGYVQVLFVAELIGLLMIYRGYRIVKRGENPGTENR